MIRIFFDSICQLIQKTEDEEKTYHNSGHLFGTRK